MVNGVTHYLCTVQNKVQLFCIYQKILLVTAT